MHLAGDAKHINLAELDTMIKGINLALQWQMTVLQLVTDCVCALLDIRHLDLEGMCKYEGSQ